MKPWMAAMAAGLVLGAGAAGQSGFYKSYLGKRPPSIQASATNWLNTDRPLTEKALAGQAVWLEFSFLN